MQFADSGHKITPKFLDQANRELQLKFRSKFQENHRELKSLIHLCQHRAYADVKNADLQACEEKAQMCFVPLLLVRRHASVIVQNAENKFYACLKEAKDDYEQNIGNVKKD